MPVLDYVVKADDFKTWRDRTNEIIDELDTLIAADASIASDLATNYYTKTEADTMAEDTALFHALVLRKR